MNVAHIDDHGMLTGSVKNMLLQQEDIDAVNTYSSVDAFFNDTVNAVPDLIITDLMMPGVSGIQLLDRCKSVFKDGIRIIVLSSIEDVPTVKQALRNGANAYLSKGAPVEELLFAIKEVMEDRQYIGKDLRDILLRNMITEEQVVYHLSPREKDVLHRSCNGNTVKEIAFDLQLSLNTIQYYLRNVMSKLNVNRTADLILFAIKNGLHVTEKGQK